MTQIKFTHNGRQLTGELVRYWPTNHRKPWRDPVIVNVAGNLLRTSLGDIAEADRSKLPQGVRLGYSPTGRHIAVNLHLSSDHLPSDLATLVDGIIITTANWLQAQIELILRSTGDDVLWSVETWLSDAGRVVGDIEVYQVKDDELIQSGYGRQDPVFTETWSGPLDPDKLNDFRGDKDEPEPPRITVHLVAPEARHYRQTASPVYQALHQVETAAAETATGDDHDR
jgi:hypothetical protein